MFTVHLKNGEVVQVPEDEVIDYIRNNRHLIQAQHKEVGKRRTAPVDTTNVSNK